MKKNKILICAAALILGFSSTACAKGGKSLSPSKNDGKTQNAKTEETKKEAEEEKPVELSPDIIKLNKVLMSMSDRFKADFKNGDPNEFLADLYAVLDEEKKFPQDDLSLYFLIDKTHPVGSDYEPKNLRKLVKNDDYIINKNTLSLRPDVEDALRVMARAAKRDGVTLDVSSTYRSYSYQKALFQHWVDVDGLVEAERESARAGTSQHQLGVAIDFGSIDDDYDTTPGGQWMYAHAEEYGWSLSFPKQYEDVTGYRWECWHFRYLGIPACQFQKKWFNDVQQYMLEFIDAWKKAE